MDPLLRLEQYKKQFTKNDMQIYRHIIAHPEQIVSQSIKIFAENCGVSQPAMTRFVKTIGYNRYQEFRADITAWLASRETPSNPNRIVYFERLQRLMDEAEKVLTDDYMTELTDYFLSFDHHYSSGVSKSSHPARLLSNLMLKNNIYAHFCPYDSISEMSDHMESSALLIVFSVAAKPDFLNRIKSTDAHIMLVTTNRNHQFQDVVERTVVLPYLPPDPEACSVSPILFDIFVELLVAYVSKHLSA